MRMVGRRAATNDVCAEIFSVNLCFFPETSYVKGPEARHIGKKQR